MLVLLVSADRVVVDDARPTPDGAPPDHLLFDGPLVEGAGGRMLPGLDVVYRLVSRVNLDPLGQVPAGIALPLSENAGPFTAWLQNLAALPVYLQLDPQAARAWREASVTGHPVTAVPRPRPHLRLAAPVELVRGPGALELGTDLPADPIEVPTFSMDGVVEALQVGGLEAGMVIRIAGMTPEVLDGLYVVGVVRPGPTGVDCDMLPLADRPGVDAVGHLRAEAERARAAAADLRTTNAEGALALIEAAAGYERHADRLAAARS